ncbi:hypothetical protein [Halalkalicoccus sp. NIPERK01]|uniref:DUF7475 family protein n=1 Tax=Halalkalicoccus sp. NIPERK01 TaxID=3053469 RepID=UPI00256E9BB7|nr:hypothetical protein [Halalkalicoccus sp. NIPERK01]MDL5363339.1 hypothetical protein [Halalkalicoccus sp. NIPERK01]
MSTTETRGMALGIDTLDGLHWLGILCALVSAGVHLLIGAWFFPSTLGISFVLAGLGFVGAVALVLVDFHRRAVYAVGIPFVLVQIVLWYWVNFVGMGKSFPADMGTLDAVDKVAQVVLLAVLVVLLRR